MQEKTAWFNFYIEYNYGDEIKTKEELIKELAHIFLINQDNPKIINLILNKTEIHYICSRVISKNKSIHETITFNKKFINQILFLALQKAFLDISVKEVLNEKV